MGEIVWHGWIRIKHPLLAWLERWRLRRLGVKGKMKYDPYHKCLTYCEVDTETMEVLRKVWPGFLPSVFTGVCDSAQLPKEDQMYWRLIDG